MSTFLYRLGRASVRRRWRVVAVWVLAVVALGVIGRSAGSGFEDRFAIPGTESQRATDLLADTFPAQAGSSAQVVFHTPTASLRDPGPAATVAATMARIGALPHVAAAADPLVTPGAPVSPDGRTALATIHYDQPTTELGTAPYRALQAAIAPAAHDGVQVELGGELPHFSERSGPSGSEAIGLLAAMVILLFAFGSLIAMGLPIATALVGLAAGMTIITFLSAFVSIPSTAETLATMVGLGVGIDYALFIITRHRAGLARGLTVEDAAGRAIATAGQAVIVAGGTVVIAICGLAVAGIPMVTFMGLGAAIVVAVMVVAAVTLLPALIGFAGHSIDRFGIPGLKPRVETGTVDEHGRYHGWARWSHHVARHPWAYVAASLAVLLLLAAPALDLRLGQTDASQSPTSSTLRRSYDLLAAGFGPGFNGPLLVAVDLGTSDGAAALPNLRAAIAADPDVAQVAAAQVAPGGRSAVLQVIPKSAPQDASTSELVQRLRADVVPTALTDTGVRAYIGGQTAAFIDLSDRVASRLPVFIGCVIALSFLLLMAVFRSIVVPLKAAVMNVLAIGAAYGVIVAVFQKGWGSELFGVHQSLPIVSFIPMFMFAVLFGLSMDYEVFLLSRIREAYLETGDNTESVVTGITTTARVITSAALIMIAVFLSFVFGDEPTIKMAGLGLATAVLIDATLVRMVLVPSSMKLLGDANWWLPAWLDRLLPNLDIEGETRLPPPELEATTPDGPDADADPDAPSPSELQPA
jgi:RND superfamily putative drug exporter